MAGWPMGPYLQVDPLSPYGKGKGSSQLPPIRAGSPEAAPARSRLDVLREQLQRRLQRERQTKLTAVYREQCHRALQRLRDTCLPPAQCNSHLPEPPWAQGQWPRARRCPGIDRCQPLKPIEGAGGLCPAGGPWGRLPSLDVPLWPGVTLRPSPPKGPSDGSRGRGREPAPPQHHDPTERPHVSRAERVIQQRLRRIEEQLRDIQRQREEEEEEAQHAQIVRVERWRRSGRERSGRHRSERESSRGERWRRSGRERLEVEGSVGERWSGAEGSGRERSERSEGERSGREGSGRERSEGQMEERAKRERGKRETESEQEEKKWSAERVKGERVKGERVKGERKERESLGEMEREVKPRERERLKRESQGGVREQGSANCHSGGAVGDRGGDGSVRSADEDCDHSNPFADYAESPAKEKQGPRDTGADGTELRESGQSESGAWNGHYSPEEKAHCSYCGRRFILDRLDTHMDICKKVHERKRKVYDSAQKRAKGTDLENYQCSHKVLPIPKVNWKKKHDCFIRMLHAAQQVELEIYRSRKVAQAAPVPATHQPDFVQCPHCSRRFQPAIGEAHIPKCKILRSRPSPPRK